VCRDENEDLRGLRRDPKNSKSKEILIKVIEKNKSVYEFERMLKRDWFA